MSEIFLIKEVGKGVINNLPKEKIVPVSKTETLTHLTDVMISDDVLYVKYMGENNLEQVKSVDLSDLTSFDINTTSLNGVTTLNQKGVNKLTVSKVGQTGSYSDLLGLPGGPTWETITGNQKSVNLMGFTDGTEKKVSLLDKKVVPNQNFSEYTQGYVINGTTFYRNRNIINYTTDYINWTQITVPIGSTDFTVKGTYQGTEILLSVRYGTAAGSRVQHSYNGIDWITNPVSLSGDLFNLKYLNQFFIIYTGFSKKLWYSLDALNWTYVNLSFLPSSNGSGDITYSTKINKFIFTYDYYNGSGYTNMIYLSSDLNTWSLSTQYVGPYMGNLVCDLNGDLIYTKDSKIKSLELKTDGSAIDVTLEVVRKNGATYIKRAGDLFIAIDSNRIYYSFDGHTWTLINDNVLYNNHFSLVKYDETTYYGFVDAVNGVYVPTNCILKIIPKTRFENNIDEIRVNNIKVNEENKVIKINALNDDYPLLDQLSPNDLVTKKDGVIGKTKASKLDYSDIADAIKSLSVVINPDGTLSLVDKQDKLISGINIKTLNGLSLIGSGDIIQEVIVTTPQYYDGGNANTIFPIIGNISGGGA